MSDSLNEVVIRLGELAKKWQDIIDERRGANRCTMCNRKIYDINIPLKDFLELNKKYITNEIEFSEYGNSIVIVGNMKI